MTTIAPRVALERRKAMAGDETGVTRAFPMDYRDLRDRGSVLPSDYRSLRHRGSVLPADGHDPRKSVLPPDSALRERRERRR